MNSTIQEDLKKLPDKPGVYIMRNKDNTVLYVGKARILKNRVRSYFQNTPHSDRITVMISQIDHFEYIVCDSEYEALLLENNLIKKHKPKYNVLLKDDKGYPYIKVTLGEPFPRVALARSVQKDGSKYYGPYHSTWMVHSTLEAIKNILPLRPCKKKIHENSEPRPCLNYHIGLCKGPCCGKISRQEYSAMTDDVLSFLNGHIDKLERKMKEKMLKAAEDLEFEQAAAYREKIKALQMIKEKQKIVSITDDSFDVAAIEKNNVDACLQIFFIRSGNVVGREYFIFEGAAADSDDAIMSSFIKQFYAENYVIPPRIYIQCALESAEGNEREFLQDWLTELRGAKCEIITPQRGDKKKLAEMVKMNAGIALANNASAYSGREQKALEILQEVLALDKIPARIEAYDISNMGDSEINASGVVFVNGLPYKKAYRKYNMKEVTKRSDIGSMHEVLSRRIVAYEEGRDGFETLPDLLLVDGGSEQVAEAEAVLREKNIKLPVYGMVKDDRHRTRSLIGNFEGSAAAAPYLINNRSNYKEFVLKDHVELWRLISSIQDEAHRFAIQQNRKMTNKRYRLSELDNIPNVGEKRKFALLKHFGSLAAIRKASREQLAEVKGISAANADKIYEYFHKEES